MVAVAVAAAAAAAAAAAVVVVVDATVVIAVPACCCAVVASVLSERFQASTSICKAFMLRSETIYYERHESHFLYITTHNGRSTGILFLCQRYFLRI